MRTLFPLYLIFTAALWAFVSQDLPPAIADSGTQSVLSDGTPPPPPGPKNQ